MRRFSFALVAVTLLTTGGGCRCCNWFHRGPQCGAPAAAAAPACGVGGGGGYSDPYAAPPAIQSAPPTYVPAPG